MIGHRRSHVFSSLLLVTGLLILATALSAAQTRQPLSNTDALRMINDGGSHVSILMARLAASQDRARRAADGLQKELDDLQKKLQEAGQNPRGLESLWDMLTGRAPSEGNMKGLERQINKAISELDATTSTIQRMRNLAQSAKNCLDKPC